MRHALRAVATLATGALIATLAAQPAQAAPADEAADWLAGELTDGIVHNDQFDFDDYGLTLDVGLALGEIGQNDAAVTEVRDALAPHVGAYTTYESEVYANAVAKLARFVQVAGGDARAYGGVDLVRRLDGRVIKRGPAAGRITDKSSGSDFGNTIGQAFAVGALHRANSAQAARATRFLVAQQCGAGWFRLGFTSGRTDGQSCREAPAAQKSASTDATALAVLELSGLPRADRTKATRSAVDKAVAWLVRSQRGNGSFGSDSMITVSNTNSTGLAGWALGARKRCARAAKAARWVQRLQVGADQAGTPLAGETGAIAYDRSGFEQGLADGIDETNADQWRRASAQAAPALGYLSGC